MFSEFSQFFRDNIDNFSDEQLKELFVNIEKWEVKEPARIGEKLTEVQQLSNAAYGENHLNIILITIIKL